MWGGGRVAFSGVVDVVLGESPAPQVLRACESGCVCACVCVFFFSRVLTKHLQKIEKERRV